MEDEECTQEKPKEEEECEAENPCGVVDWMLTDWSGCPDDSCGEWIIMLFKGGEDWVDASIHPL